MKIGILGTRGIPNRYGGFEQFAEYLSLGLVQRGHEVCVYNSSLHPYQERNWRDVHIIHCYDPEDKIGTAGQFIYDLNCIRDARGRDFDILLQLGYTSSSIWAKLLPGMPLIVTNMDGLEWKRSKYGNAVKKFLSYAERWAVKSADVLVADSKGIQDYLMKRFQKQSVFIPYGAETLEESNPKALEPWNVVPQEYYMLIARMEPENNIEVILEGYERANDNRPFLVVGNAGNTFGLRMQSRFRETAKIRFTGAIYDAKQLDQLRHFARLYFHGHSVGGTNPSLLEAMGAGALIAAHDNPFNRSVLEGEAFYFEGPEDIAGIIDQCDRMGDRRQQWTAANRQKIVEHYRWDQIIDAYAELFKTEREQQS